MFEFILCLIGGVTLLSLIAYLWLWLLTRNLERADV